MNYSTLIISNIVLIIIILAIIAIAIFFLMKLNKKFQKIKSVISFPKKVGSFLIVKPIKGIGKLSSKILNKR